ncbi:MAG TPA: ABC transporter permease [bacterium]|nr:ABC transporter permease [bacterium]
MAAYLTRRLVQSLFILFAVSLASFWILRAAPGDPVEMYLSEPFHQTPPAVIAAVRHQLGLDQPTYVQYGRWLAAFLRGDMGYSLVTHAAVAGEIADALPKTFLLMSVATGFGLLAGILLGVWSALRPNGAADTVLASFAAVGFAVPQFWVGLVLIYLLSYVWPMLPSSGMMNAYALSPTTRDVAVHLVLPAATLAVNEVAYWQRYQRDSLLKELTAEYVRTARAKGLRGIVVVFRHAWPNSLVAIVTLLGLSLTRLIAGSYIVETIFSWPGMGYLGISAVDNRDYPVVMAILMVSAVLTLAGNFLADLLHTVVDPRVRLPAAKPR